MVVALGILKAEFIQDEEQHFEVVFLLVAHGVDLVRQPGEIAVAQNGSTDVLGHVHGRTVFAEQEFFIQPVFGQVHPNGAVFAFVEGAGVQAFEHFVLACEVGVAFVVELVEVHSHFGVGGVKPGVHPAVHGLPKGYDFGIFVLPLDQHFSCRLEQLCLLLGLVGVDAAFDQGVDLGLVLLVKTHVVLAHQVVPFDAAGFWSFSASKALPSHHGLANVNAAVVDDLHLLHLVPHRFQNARYGVPQEVVAQVAQMQWLVGVGRRVLHHHQRFGTRFGKTKTGIGHSLSEKAVPVITGEHQVQKAFDHPVALHEWAMLLQVRTNGFRGQVRRGAGHFHVREHHHGKVAFEFFAGLLDLNRVCGHFGAVQVLDGSHHSIAQGCEHRSWCIHAANFHILGVSTHRTGRGVSPSMSALNPTRISCDIHVHALINSHLSRAIPAHNHPTCCHT